MAAILESINDKQDRHQKTHLVLLIRQRLLSVSVCAPTWEFMPKLTLEIKSYWLPSATFNTEKLSS